MSRATAISAVLLGWLLAMLVPAGPLAALETDQYLAWEQPLADSREAVNTFVNQGIERVLERLERRRREIPCQAIPHRVYRHLFGSLISSPIRRFAHGHPAVERIPGSEVGYWGYLKASVYRRPAFPFLLPMSRTIEVAGVRLGADKLGHMFGFGRRYYARYLRARRRGLSEEEAVRRVVLWGIRMERIFVGGLSDGVFSYADLEANFQGLRLARALCEGDRPHLQRGTGGWRLARPVDLGDYVNPYFDESYNTNHYPRYRWKRVRPILVEEVCPRRHQPAVEARMRRYRQLEGTNPSRRAIAAYFARRGRDPQAEQSLAAICPPAAPRTVGPVSTADP